MQLKTQRIKLAALVQNTGQIPGLPSNPRQWTKEDIDTIAKSLKETPELFEARPIIAVPFDGKYVILCGNLRYEGAKKNGDKDVPVCIIPEDTPVEKMKEIVIKDNGSFGAWDYDALANEWDDNPLGDWGVPAWDTPASDPGAIAAIFEKAGDPKPKPTIIEIGVPVGMEDKMEDIRAALLSALKDWPGCKIL